MNDLFFIASLKHTHKHHEHIVWWGPNGRGYTPVVGDFIGEYSAGEAAALNDGIDYIAVSVESVRTMLSPTPHFRPHDPIQFYDQKGPVVDNTRANWNRLIALSLAHGRHTKPKPEPYRGVRRSFATAAEIGRNMK